MLSRGRFRAARAGLAGIEFALVLPFMLALLAGLVDLSMAVVTARRLSDAADDVALIASTIAVQTGSLNVLSGRQAWQATTAPLAIFPDWNVAGGAPTFAITLSEIDFAGSGASLVAHTRWSVAGPRGQVLLRPCGTLAAVANGSAPSLTTLPTGAFGPTSVLVGDVSSMFVPMFTGVFTGPFTMLRSAYISPRVNTGIRLSGTSPGPAVICPAQGS